MNKQEKLHKLKMKYFWKQKAEEICKFVIIVSGSIFIPYSLGRLGELFWEMTHSAEIPHFIVLWIIGLLYLMVLMMIGCVAYLIADILKRWIQSNMEKAESRAMDELK